MKTYNVAVRNGDKVVLGTNRHLIALCYAIEVKAKTRKSARASAKKKGYVVGENFDIDTNEIYCIGLYQEYGLIAKTVEFNTLYSSGDYEDYKEVLTFKDKNGDEVYKINHLDFLDRFKFAD